MQNQPPVAIAGEEVPVEQEEAAMPPLLLANPDQPKTRSYWRRIIFLASENEFPAKR